MHRLGFLILLIVLPFFVLANLYFLDRNCFSCPIGYKWDIVIRSDSRGSGYFESPRNGRRVHNGIDLFAEIGSSVSASGSGRVLACGKKRGMGNFVIVSHPGGLTTVYGHLLSYCVTKNQFLRQGQVIGKVGKTGNASHPAIQPHLHFEVRKNGVPQNPFDYL